MSITIIVISIIVISAFAMFLSTRPNKVERAALNEELKKIMAYAIYPLEFREGKTPVQTARNKRDASFELKVCLDQDICPKCGNELEVKKWDNGDDEILPEDYKVKYCEPCEMRSEVYKYFY